MKKIFVFVCDMNYYMFDQTLKVEHTNNVSYLIKHLILKHNLLLFIKHCTQFYNSKMLDYA